MKLQEPPNHVYTSHGLVRVLVLPWLLPKRLMYPIAHIRHEQPKPRKGIVFAKQFKGIRYQIGNKTC